MMTNRFKDKTAVTRFTERLTKEKEREERDRLQKMFLIHLEKLGDSPSTGVAKPRVKKEQQVLERARRIAHTEKKRNMKINRSCQQFKTKAAAIGEKE